MPLRVVTSEELVASASLAEQNQEIEGSISGEDGTNVSEIVNINKGNTMLLSNNKSVKTKFWVPDQKEHYDAATYEQNFDTELVQLVTDPPPPPPLEPPPLVVAPIIAPPELMPPTGLIISATNHRWTMNGPLGRTLREDKPQWHSNYHPLGNNAGGGALYTPDDNPLFYINRLKPKDDLQMMNYEWSFDGEVISTKPYAMMYNIPSQGEKWRDVKNMVVKLRVWNAAGQQKAEYPFRVADNVYESANPGPMWSWKGVRHWDEDKFYDGKWTPLTSYQMDPQKRLRNIIIEGVWFQHWGDEGSETSQFYIPYWDKRAKGEYWGKPTMQWRWSNRPWKKRYGYQHFNGGVVPDPHSAGHMTHLNGHGLGVGFETQVPGGERLHFKFHYGHRRKKNSKDWYLYTLDYKYEVPLDAPDEINLGKLTAVREYRKS